MKLLKAYVRTFMVKDVVNALKEMGAPRLTAINVQAMGDEIAPEKLDISTELGSSYTTMVKLELICTEQCIEKVTEIIQQKAKTGKKGDGIIVISSIDDVIRIRTGERGQGAH